MHPVLKGFTARIILAPRVKPGISADEKSSDSHVQTTTARTLEENQYCQVTRIPILMTYYRKK